MSALVAVLAAAVREGVSRAEEGFWGEVAERGAPLVEPIPGDPQHRAVTFLWRGDQVGRALALVNRLSDPLRLADGLMERVPGTGVWHLTYRLEADHSGSYRLAADEGTDPSQDALRELAAGAVHDPLNEWNVPVRWGDGRSSVFALPDAPAPVWTPWRSQGVAARGTVATERIRSALLDDEREVWLYRPPVPPQGVVLLLDGDMWFGKCGAQGLFDRLAADGTPLAVVSPHAVSTHQRMSEYNGNEAHTAFLVSELMPWAAKRLPIDDDPARTAVAGESLGGLTALHVGLEAPERFGRVLAQSPSLWWNPEGERTEDSWLVGRYASAPRRDLRVHLRVGRHEWALVDRNRELHRTLLAKGYPVTYTEYNGGHDHVCWTDGLAAGLAGLFKG